MPKIKDYSSNVSAAKPIQGRLAQAEDFGDYRGLREVGEGISSLAGAAEKSASRAEVSDLYAQMSEVHSKTAIGLNEQLQNADPGDKEFASRFVKDFDDQMQSIGDNVSTSAGKEFFAKTSSAYRSHFYEAAALGQSALAGKKAVTDYQNSLNQMSSALVNDPSSYPLLKEQHQNFLDSGAVPAEAKLKLEGMGKEQLAKSAIAGWINLNPDYAKRQLSEGLWDKDIDGATKVQMLSHADQAIRAEEAEAERQKRKEAEIEAQKQVVTQNTFLQKLVNKELTANDILKSNLDPFGSGSKHQFIDMVKADNEKLRTDPNVFTDIFSRAHLPDNDPRKIWDENVINQAVIDQKLTFDDAMKLRGEVQGKRTAEGSTESKMKNQVFEIAKSELVKTDPAIGLKDPVGEENMLQFMRYFDDTFTKKRKEGIPALDLLDPSNKEYIGRAIPQFKRTPSEQIKSLTQGLNKVVQPERSEDFYRKTNPDGTKEDILTWRKRRNGR